MNHQRPKALPRNSEHGPARVRRPARSWMFWVMVIAMLTLLGHFVFSSRRKTIDTWAQFKELVRQDGVSAGSVELHNSKVYATLKKDFQQEGLKPEAGKELPIAVRIDRENREFYLNQLDELGVAWRDRTATALWPTLVLLGVPLLLLLLFLGIAARARLSQSAGILGHVTSSRHRLATKEDIHVTLHDVAGIDEAKAEVSELIQFLQFPGRFQRIGARVPRGVLLHGPPGCGKTLLARAIAGEADVPFFSISGSDFMEMFVGVGASRVRHLFAEAKESAPCMIFLDEIDSIGRRRGAEMMAGGHGEREQTLNAILSEMDGFEPHDQVIVIAATNRPDVLDPALTRRGRFDRQMAVPLPDFVGREEILKIHARNVKLARDVDFERIARATPLFSGADLAALVNEAAISAALQEKKAVAMEDLEQARDKVRLGREQKSRRIEHEQRERCAYHEAGHALLQLRLEDADAMEKVTIIPRGPAMGATFALPEKDRYGFGRDYLLATMRVLCGGRISEHRKTGDISSGAADDIDKVTQIAKKMVRQWGMSDRLGFIKYSDEESGQRWFLDREYAETTASKIDDEVRRLVDEAYRDAEAMIEGNWASVVAIAEALLERETLAVEDVQRLVDLDVAGQPEAPHRVVKPLQPATEP